MYDNQYDEFVKLLTDLCISTNRPYNNDLVRVFWEDLKHVPFPEIQRAAAALRTKGQVKFSSNDLRPPPTAAPSGAAWDNNAIVARLSDHMARVYWPRLTMLQRLYKHEFLYIGPREAPRCTGLRILPDEDSPGILIRVEDCDLDSFESRDANVRAAMPPKTEDWNEADAARDLLNRKS